MSSRKQWKAPWPWYQRAFLPEGGGIHSFLWLIFVEMIKGHTLGLIRTLTNKKTYLFRSVHQV